MITVPNPLGFISIPESELDQIEISAEAKSDVAPVFDAINEAGIQGYRCANCSTLVLFEKGRDGEATYYKKEDLPLT